MKTLVIAITAVVIISTATISSAFADLTTDDLSACLADNTTGKDRKDLARWVFVGMASHPEIRTLSNVTHENQDAINKIMASMVMRLMTESCQVQTRSAMEKNGATAIKTAFGVLGKLAMQELMSNPNANAAFAGFEKYIDQNKLNTALSRK